MIDFIKFLIILLLFNLSNNTAIAQEIRPYNQKAQLTFAKIKKYDSSYRVNYFEDIILKMSLSSNTPNFVFIDNQTGLELEIRPVAEYKLGFSFDYKWFALGFSFTPTFLMDDKGIEELNNSQYFGININFFYSDRWRQELGYNYYEGFFTVENSIIEDIDLLNTTLHLIQGSTFFIANRNFSFRAHYAQTERQLKSAGSLIPKLVYNFSQTTPNFINSNLPSKNIEQINSLNVYAQMGYLYTFVHNQKWFATVGVHPGLGYNYSNFKYNDDTQTIESSNDLALALAAETSLGYNSYRWFFGTSFNWRNYNYTYNQNNVFISNNMYFNMYLGYRFNDNIPMRKFFGWFEDTFGF